MVTVVLFTFGAVLLRQFGLRGFGTASPAIYQTGNTGRILIPVSTVFLTGWEAAALSVFIGFVVGPFLADLLIYPVLKKGSETSFSDFRSIAPWRAHQRSIELERAMASKSGEALLDFVKGSIGESEEHEDEVRKLGRITPIAEVLAKHGKDADDLVRIEHQLRAAGLGRRIPRKLVSTPRLLDEFYGNEADGVPLEQSMSLYIQRFGWVT
jgi:hypothetical protein